jgi:ubiquitin C-terminal hydrolase
MNAFISLSRLLPANLPPTQTLKKPSTALYRLNSVLVHLGGISEAGHFIIYRRRVDSDQWLSISDDHIRDCSELQVFASMAYILFYERIKKN